jgi:hypothetical protein
VAVANRDLDRALRQALDGARHVVLTEGAIPTLDGTIVEERASVVHSRGELDGWARERDRPARSTAEVPSSVVAAHRGGAIEDAELDGAVAVDAPAH